MDVTRRIFAAGSLALPFAARASTEYPSRNVTVIAPFAPGASADGIARIVADGLAPRFGRPVIVENRPGAGGSTGLIALARSEPDGYTLGVGATGALVINPHVPSAAAAFAPLRELAPIAKLIDIPIVLVASPSSGLRTVADVIRVSRERPGGLSYGTTGVNSAQHLSIELLRRATGATLVHVPYRGSAPAVTDVLGGQVPLASLDLTAADPHLRSGGLVGVAVTSRARVSFFPDIPTLGEAAVPGLELAAWIGLFGPARLPTGIEDRIASDVSAALADETLRQRVRQLACVPDYMPPAEFRAFLEKTSAGMEDLIRSLS